MSIVYQIKDYLLTKTAKLFPKSIISLRFKKHFGRDIDWDNPKDINEKIQWLKFNTDTSIWTQLADKYEVRNYVKKCIGAKYLVPLYGVWDSPYDIDFSQLPNSFVLKPNHGAGSVLIVKDKSKLDIPKTINLLSDWLKTDFGIKEVEPHYLGIKRKIIAEGLLDEHSDFTSSLVDYKIWCFNGNVFGTWCCFNRSGFVADTEWHDLDWKFRPEWSIFTTHYKNGQGSIPKPPNYDEMLKVASKLSKGFPEVRVDLYNIDGRIYFGEMTFSCAGGYINFYSNDILNKLGDLTILPQKNNNNY